MKVVSVRAIIFKLENMTEKKVLKLKLDCSVLISLKVKM